MKRWILLVGALLVIGSVPVTTARHLSTGYEDGIATEPRETPDDPSVPGADTWQGQGPSPFERGTTPAEDCQRQEGESGVSQANVSNATQADGFCNMLVYHHNVDALRQVSPPDQQLFDPIGTFDVIQANNPAFGIGVCEPMCPQGQGLQPAGGDLAWDTVHDNLNNVDPSLVHDGDEARERERSDGAQQYGVTVDHPTATTLVQSETGTWEMNGWLTPQIARSMVAFVEDEDGNRISEGELENIVEAKKDAGELPASASVGVCGYTPDFQFTTVSADAAGTNCEFEFEWRGPNDRATDGNVSFREGYRDRCESPTYVCGATNGGAWYYRACVCLGLTDPEIPGYDPLPTVAGVPNDDGSPFEDPEYQTDYMRIHFIVAPHDPENCAARQPQTGFGTVNANKPFLAHDLDVFTPATSVSAVPNAETVPEAYDYVDAVADNETATLGDTVNDATGVLGELPGTPDNARETLTLVSKQNTLEPNYDGDVGGLEDTSRSQLPADDILSREDPSPCERLTIGDELPENRDPWVDYLDSNAAPVQNISTANTQPVPPLGLYLNDDEDQDPTNRPGPNLYNTQGMVGIFADINDDGNYEQNEGGTKYDQREIAQTGAYPMMWNMWATEDGEIDPAGGCEVTETSFSAAMENLGYGVETALIQAVYLREPTAFFESGNPQNAVTFDGGNNIYLIMSNAAHRQHTEGLGLSTLQTEIDTLTQAIKDYVDAPEEINIHVPAETLGLQAGLLNQCTGSTGNFASSVTFAHDCSLNCEQDTIVTKYTFDLTDPHALSLKRERPPNTKPTRTSHSLHHVV